MDSVYCHANWGNSLGGVSFPLLADFEPKGGLAKSLGVFLDEKGITDRATVLIDREGIVRYCESAGPGGRRNIADLAAECEKVGGDALPDPGTASGTLYVKNGCGASRAALLALANLHLSDSLTVKNVDDDAAAKSELVTVGGKDQAPCLIADGTALYESADIVSSLVGKVAPIGLG